MSELADDSEDDLDGIAIIGMSGRFPGAENLDRFWENLRQGVESVSRFSREELLAAGVPQSRLDDPNFVPAKSVIDDADAFDAAFFGYLPKESEMMDPQHRVFLECAWSAIEDAGYDVSRYSGLVGVYGGMSQQTYPQLIRELDPQGQKYNGYPLRIGTDKDYLTTRVSYKLNLRGPSMDVQTACSTSLVAVCQACQSLLNYQCDMALAGGVAISTPLLNGHVYQEGGIHSPDGHCRPFDLDSQGIVEGDGVGIVVLKRLSDAIEDNDSVLAVVKGFALNNDGTNKVGFTAPSEAGQAEVISMAQALAGVEPDSISYIEAHGTGTSLGDPIEIAGLTKAFREGTDKCGFCAIGSLKSNIGHLDTAAGVASLIKTVLAMKNRQIPPSLHFNRPNPNIDFENSPFFVNATLQDWKSNGQPRRAGVSSFGLGGTNAHVVLEEAPPTEPLQANGQPQLLVLSARSDEALDEATSNLARALREKKNDDLADVAYTLQEGRREFTKRRALVAKTLETAASLLESGSKRLMIDGSSSDSDPEIIFLFTGQGSQRVNMGRELYDCEAVFKETIDQCAAILEPHLDLDIRLVLYPEESSSKEAQKELNETRLTQPALFVIEYALAQLWLSWGIKPAAMLGHSIGEYVAATLAGVFSLEDALGLVARRGALIQSQPSGSMLAVRATETDILPLLGTGVSIAAINAPRSCVVSGSHDAITGIQERFAAEKIDCRPLSTSHAFHSEMMNPVLEPFKAAFDGLNLNKPVIPYVSNVTGTWIKEEEATSPEYWARHIGQAVRFADGIEALADKPERVLLEIGPGHTLSQLARQNPGGRSAKLVTPSLKTDEVLNTEYSAFLGAVGRLWIQGVYVDWAQLRGSGVRRRVALPTYPFERKRYWPSRANEPAPDAVSPPGYDIQPAIQENRSASSSGDSEVTTMSNLTDRKSLILAELSLVLHELSGIEIDSIEPDKTFMELGFDSLLLGQANMAFRKAFGVKLRYRDFFDTAPTPDEMAVFLERKVDPDKFAASPSAENVQPVVPENSATNSVESSVDRRLQAAIELARQQLAILEGGSAPVRRAPVASKLPVSDPLRDQKDRSAPIKIFGGSGELSYLRTPPRTWQPLEKGPDGELTSRQKASLEQLVNEYSRKTAESKRINQEIRAQTADPRTIVGFSALWKETVYQIVSTRSSGSKLWDPDGNEFIDVTLGFGSAMFGHSPDFVVDAIKKQVELGMEVGAQTPLVAEVSQLFCELTGHERVCYCTSGTEAVMGALRLARAHTGRDHFATFVGDIHGRLDETTGRPVIVNNSLTSVPGAPGIASHLVKPALFLEFGNPASLESIERYADQLAAVLVEPIRTRSPDLQPIDFLRDLRKLARKTGITFICDEVVTGFRVAQGGAQALFDLKPDLSTWGKGCAAGMPMGAISGKSELMDALDGGDWKYGDDSVPEAAMTNFGGAGTFAKHPYVMAASLAALRYMKEQGPKLQEELTQRATRFVTSLNDYFIKEDIPIHLEHFGSYWVPRVLGDRKFEPLLFVYLRMLGVHTYVDYPCFISTAHTDADIEALINAFKEAARMMQEGGFLPELSADESSRESVKSEYEISVPSSKPEKGKFPLTSAQKEIWLATKLGAMSAAAFNLSASLELQGPLNRDALFEALQQVVARHEALRLVVDPDGELQRFLPEVAIGMPFLDWSMAEEQEKNAMYSEFISSDVGKIFDLEKGPLIRTSLIRFSEERHHLVLTWCHIVSDGWSAGMIFRDLSAFYTANLENTEPQLPIALQYSDYLAWRSAPEQVEDMRDAKRFWLETFADSVPVLDLPTDRPRPRLKSFDGDERSLFLKADFMKEISGLAASHGCTEFTVLFAAFNLLLHRLSDQNDIVVGLAAAGQPVVGDDNLVGHCVSLLPCRSKIEKKTAFEDYLLEIRSSLMDAYDNQSSTYGDLIEDMNVPRDPSRLPLVSAIVTYETDTAGIEFTGLEAKISGNARVACNFDLELYITESKEGADAAFCFNTDLFDADTIERWLNHYVSLLKEAVSNPNRSLGALPLLSPDEKRQYITGWNDTNREFASERTVFDLVDEQLFHSPERIAVVYEDEQITYGDFAQLISGIAKRLHQSGVQAGDLVGVFLDRSPSIVASLLAIWKCGAAYVPLDPSYPKERISAILEDAKVRLLVSESELADSLPTGSESIICLDEKNKGSDLDTEKISFSKSSPDSLAYVMFTSGSTGKPKGVAIEHRSVVNLLQSICREPGFGKEDTMLAVATISFDISVAELFLPLVSGGKLVIASQDTASDGQKLRTLLESSGTTFALPTPITWRMLLEAGWNGKEGLTMVSTGEPLPSDLAKELLEKGDNLWNLYGPTETTIWSTGLKVEGGESISIGRPIANTQVYIVNDFLEPQPIGIPGELLIGGEGLAREYLGRPDMTDEKFIANPFEEGRLYRTGDLAKWKPDGTIECLGRIDFQVKVRGYRIELGEIESLLNNHSGIRQAVVDTGEDTYGDLQLVAYLEKESGLNGNAGTPAEFKEYLRASLPEYMVPQEFVFVQSIPQTLNGKADRKALKGQAVAGTTTEVSQRVARWAERESELADQLDLPDSSDLDVATPLLDQLCSAYMARYIESCGVQIRAGSSIAKVSFLEKLKVTPEFLKFVDYMLSVLEEDGVLKREREHICFLRNSSKLPDALQLQTLLNRKLPNYAGLLEVIERCGTHLAEGLAGDISPITVLFPDGNRVWIDEKLLKESAQWNDLALYKKLAADYIVAKAKEKPLRVLEVGGGAGLITWQIAPILKSLDVHYVFSDVGATFVAEAKRESEKRGLDYIKCIQYDITHTASEQGLDEQSFDIIFGLNVVHATPDIQKSVSNLKNLLKPGGELCLVELLKTPRWENLIWGFAKDWWCFDDKWRHDVPVVDLDTWERVLSETGLSAWSIPAQGDKRRAAQAGMIVGTANAESAESGKPQTELEKLLLNIWENTLGRSGIRINDNFFDLGGHSLQAVRIQVLVKERLGVSIDTRELFASPTVAMIAEVINERVKEQCAPNKTVRSEDIETGIL